MHYYSKANPDVTITPDKVFLGGCFGVAITFPHGGRAAFAILVEDDGSWFDGGDCGDAFRLSDIRGVVDEAIAWLDRNCDKNPHGWTMRKDGADEVVK